MAIIFDSESDYHHPLDNFYHNIIGLRKTFIVAQREAIKMIGRYVSLCDNEKNNGKNDKQVITLKTQNGPNEESQSAKPIPGRQVNNPDIIHKEVTVDKEYPAPSSFNPSDLEEDDSGGNIIKIINYFFDGV